MQTAVLILSIFLISPDNDFEYSISMREFDSALEAAGGSDSLRAEVFFETGNYSMAALLFEKAFNEDPSPGLFTALWASIASSTEFYPSMPSIILAEQLDEWGNELRWDPTDLLSLIETSSALEDSVLTDSLVLNLVSSFPCSDEASQVIGWEFYDRLYPIWYDDSARVVVLGEFIEEWGESSSLWRSLAWQYTLSAVTATADSSDWENYFSEWLESCPENPQVYLTGAALHIDRDSSWSEALELADIGLSLVREGWKPTGMPDEEWQLTGNALEAGLHFRRLFALSGSGRRAEALCELNRTISTTEFSIDDYHTEASLNWLAGRLHLADGDTSEALRSFSESAAQGEVRNRWSADALETMLNILPSDITPAQWAGEYRGYTGPVFTEVTSMLGEDSLLHGSRISWCDWNCDGYPDLFAGNTLFQNNEGTSFTDITSEAGLDSCRGNGGIWGDINNDGMPDLVTSGSSVQIFMSKDGVLRDVTGSIGIGSTDSRVEGVALLDWNNDGWLDLYLASYEEPGNMGTGTADAFYLGGPDGFIPAGEELGMVPFLDKHLCGRGVSPCDFDLDGDIDIFVSNYRLQENFLWENDNGTTVNSALRRGVAGTDTDGWWGHTIGSVWGDYDNDGDWDLFSANLAHPRYISFSDRSMLLENREGVFTDVRNRSGIRFEETFSNPVWGDYNNDGLLDLYVTSIYSDRRSFLYINSGNGRFEDVTWLSGSRVFNGWGAAAADYNLDGRLDLAIGSGDGPTLLENVTPDGYWTLVNVSPPDGVNPSGLGCSVRLQQDDVILMRQVEGGSGTTSQNGGILHFGLPSDQPFILRLYIPGSTEPHVEMTCMPGSVITLGDQNHP